MGIIKHWGKLPPEREHLVLDNLALVTFLIKRYIYVEQKDYEDIFQTGCLGLVKAAIGFDESKGIQFSTYASTYILGTIHRYQRDNCDRYYGMKVSRKILDNHFKIQALRSKDLTKEEISKELGISIKDIEATYVYISSIDAYINVNEDSSITLGDTIESKENGYNEVIGEETFEVILSELKKRLKEEHYNIAEELIYAYTIGGEKLSQEQLAVKYKHGQGNISRIVKNIRKELLKILNDLDKD